MSGQNRGRVAGAGPGGVTGAYALLRQDIPVTLVEASGELPSAPRAATFHPPTMEMLDLTPDMLLRAYDIGVFPMAEDRDDPELFWVDPRLRGVIPLDAFHVPRRLRRTVRGKRFEVTFEHDFHAVITACADATQARPQTWINERIITLYTSLYHMGHAHSVECWRDGALAGGLYGITLGGAFFGESMFSLEPAASKVARVHPLPRPRAGGFPPPARPSVRAPRRH